VEEVDADEVTERRLFVLEVAGPDNVPSACPLPGPYFACLLAWDAQTASDESIAAVASRLLRAGCVYVCCWGPDCSRVHDLFDLAELELRPDGPWAMSTWHGAEPLSEALWFLLSCSWPDDAYFDGCRAAVGIVMNSPTWAAEVRAALSAPRDFLARCTI
jgi:hypothetical protein